MNTNSKTLLFGDKLLNCKAEDYRNVPISMTESSDTVGISSDGNGTYFVYQKGDRGKLDWKKSFESFDDALECAKAEYSALHDLLQCLYRNSEELSRRKAGALAAKRDKTMVVAALNVPSFIKELVEKLISQINLPAQPAIHGNIVCSPQRSGNRGKKMVSFRCGETPDSILLFNKMSNKDTLSKDTRVNGKIIVENRLNNYDWKEYEISGTVDNVRYKKSNNRQQIKRSQKTYDVQRRNIKRR